MSDFYNKMVGKYLVLRTYSHTDKRELLRVMTRPMLDLLTAGTMKSMAAEDAPRGQEVLMVRIVSETDSEHAFNREVSNSWHAGYNECKRRIKAGEQYDFTNV